MELILTIFILIGINAFFGAKDLHHAFTEKTSLSNLNRSNYTKPQKVVKKVEAAENSKLWHRYGGAGYLFIAFLVSFLKYEKGYIYAILLFFIVLSMRVAVFNPIIAIGLNQSFFYLSNKGIDGFFKRTIGQKAYYFLAIAIIIGATVYLTIVSGF